MHTCSKTHPSRRIPQDSIHEREDGISWDEDLTLTFGYLVTLATLATLQPGKYFMSETIQLGYVITAPHTPQLR